MLVSTLLEASLRKIGAMSSGETIEPTRQAEALSALQSMLRSWGGMSNNVFASVKEAIPLVIDKSLYTWGVGGDIDSLRPHKILGAYILDNEGVTHPVDIISEGRYRSITMKTLGSRPYILYFHPSYALAEVYLYPVPIAAESLYIDSYKPFVETASFALVTDTLVFPCNYEEPIIYNLALRLAPEYGRTVPPAVALIAKSSFDDINILNAANTVEPVYIAVPACGAYGAGYSINTNCYC